MPLEKLRVITSSSTKRKSDCSISSSDKKLIDPLNEKSEETPWRRGLGAIQTVSEFMLNLARTDLI